LSQKVFGLETPDMETKVHITVFFCSQQGERIGQILERLNGEGSKKFRRVPLPCSGKLEVFQLTKALESGADAVALFGCPEGACRYLVGSSRAKGRVAHTGRILEEIGLEKDRVRRFVLGDQDSVRTTQEIGEWVNRIQSWGTIRHAAADPPISESLPKTRI
jgi:coenzyme F420-reducing hydrogenase delta subunit